MVIMGRRSCRGLPVRALAFGADVVSISLIILPFQICITFAARKYIMQYNFPNDSSTWYVNDGDCTGRVR